jgi:hypothetical protein
MSLDVNADNFKAISFYQRIGMDIIGTYTSPNKVEFTQFETPKGFKPILGEPDTKSVSTLLNDLVISSKKGMKETDEDKDSDQETQSSKSDLIDQTLLKATFG